DAPGIAVPPFRRTLEALDRFVGLFRYNLPGAIGAIILAVFIVLALFAPLISPYDPNAQDLRATLLPPSLDHLAGTDQYGRDLFSRLLYGARTTLLIVLGVSLLVAP